MLNGQCHISKNNAAHLLIITIWKKYKAEQSAWIRVAQLCKWRLTADGGIWESGPFWRALGQSFQLSYGIACYFVHAW